MFIFSEDVYVMVFRLHRSLMVFLVQKFETYHGLSKMLCSVWCVLIVIYSIKDCFVEIK